MAFWPSQASDGSAVMVLVALRVSVTFLVVVFEEVRVLTIVLALLLTMRSTTPLGRCSYVVAGVTVVRKKDMQSAVPFLDGATTLSTAG